MHASHIVVGDSDSILYIKA